MESRGSIVARETALVCRVLAAVLGLSLTAGSGASRADDLWPWTLAGEKSEVAARSPERLVAYAVRIDPRIFKAGGLADAATIRLPLGVDELVVDKTGVEVRRPSDFAWRGRTVDSRARVVLTARNGFLVGAVFGGADGTWELGVEAGIDGRPEQVLLRLAPERFGPCLVEEKRPSSVIPVKGDAPPSIDPVDRIQLLSLYTAPARDAAGGVAAIEATIQAAVDVGNTAFLDSNMDARFELVHTELSLMEETEDPVGDWRTMQADPVVHAMRDRYLADMVSWVVEGTSGCGIANGMDYPVPEFAPLAYQMTRRICAVGNLTFVHEHGHNMGFNHNPEVYPPDVVASYPWSFAHYYDGAYRTVMSYDTQCPSGCPRVPHFSNPDIFHDALATGVLEERDNARTGDLTAPIVTDFRLGLYLFSDGFESGDTTAWGAFP